MKKCNLQNHTAPAISIIGDDMCTGCGACIDACAQNALDINLSVQGFYRPVVKKDMCTECGACSHHCPIISSGEDQDSSTCKVTVFGGWSADNTIREKSSSGGIAYELGYGTIMSGGIVYGCAMDKNLTAHHIMVDKISDLTALQGSKYIPSLLHGIYRRAAREAASGRNILFTGTPCQVAAFKTFLNPRNKKNVLLADLICHGVPSMLFWKRHLAESVNSKTVSVSFRNKKYGWESPAMSYEFADGNCKIISSSDDRFSVGFSSGVFLQHICFRCPFASVPRRSDITLGDYWGVNSEWNDNRGVSVMVASTQHGISAINRLEQSGRILVFRSDLNSASRSNPRLIHPHKEIHPQHAKAMHDLVNNVPLKEIAKLYLPSPYRRIVRKCLHPCVKDTIRCFQRFVAGIMHNRRKNAKQILASK